MVDRVRFSIVTHWISNLGDSRGKTFIPFNLVIIFYSIFNLFFINKIRSFLPNNFQTEVTAVLFYTFSPLLILLLFFPVNKNYKVHRVLSNLIFISIIGALLLSFLQLSKTTSIPFTVIFFLALTTIVGSIFLISFIKLQVKYNKIPKTLANIRRKEKSLLIKNACLMEWFFFFLIICFQMFVVYF